MFWNESNENKILKFLLDIINNIKKTLFLENFFKHIFA